MKLEPAILTALIVTGAVPVEVSVSGCDEDVSTVTSPKLSLAALAVSCGLVAACPLPVRLMVDLAFAEELLSMVTVPVEAPASTGMYLTCKVTDCLGFNVRGNVRLEISNSEPLIVTEFTVTGAVPVEVSVNGCVEDEPTVTLPKLMLDGLTVSWGVDSCVPVPARVMTDVLLVAEFE